MDENDQTVEPDNYDTSLDAWLYSILISVEEILSYGIEQIPLRRYTPQFRVEAQILSEVIQEKEIAQRVGLALTLLEVAFINQLCHRQTTIENLDWAISHHLSFIELLQQHDLGVDAPQSVLAILYHEKYAYTYDLEDLEMAIRIYALTLNTTNNPEILTKCYYGMATCLRDRFLLVGGEDASDLRQSIKYSQMAIDAAPAEFVEPHLLWNSLGNNLADLYKIEGNADTLAASINALERAVQLVGSDSSITKGIILMNLTMGLLDQYDLFADSELLVRAKDTILNSLRILPANASARSMALNTLGNVLIASYEATGKIENLNNAIEAYQEAGDLSNEQNRSIVAASLANALRMRFKHNWDLDDLDQAIMLSGNALGTISENNADFVLLTLSLANNLIVKYDETKDKNDIDQAIERLRSTIEGLALDKPGLHIFAHSLGSAYLARYQALKDQEDLNQAITYTEIAVDPEIRGGNFHYSGALNNLGICLLERYKVTKSTADLHRAWEVFESACQIGENYAPSHTLSASSLWGDSASNNKNWAEAKHAYQYGLDALDLLYQTQFLFEDQQALLRSSWRLPLNAAYALSYKRDFEPALQVLENGRTRLFANLFINEYRNLQAITDQAPELHDDFIRISSQLSQLQRGHEIDLLHSGKVDDATVATLTEQLDHCIKEIRKLPGFASFLLKKEIQEIIAEVDLTIPVVYLVATKEGAGALMVYEKDQIGFEWIPLGWFHFETDIWSEWFSRLRQHNVDPQRWEDSIEMILRQLWQFVMNPVIEALESRNYSEVTLIPTGWLSLLPLHAAWTVQGGSNRKYALDRISFRYAPSIAMLAHAQQIAISAEPVSQFIGIENTQDNLSFASVEVQLVSDFFENARQLRDVDSDMRDSLFGSPPERTVFHFAVHGINEWNNPLNSRLLISDNPLMVNDLLSLSTSLDTRLVVLSSCESGLVGADAPDELVGLSAAFLEAGAAAVISTLWQVSDISAMLLMARFYDNWCHKKLPLARSLQQAQCWLRDATASELENIFAGWRRQDVAWLPQLSSAWRRFAAMEPDNQPFAHPYHWAAFSITGA